MPIEQLNGKPHGVAITLLAVLAALLAAADAWRVASNWAAIDYYQFWVVGQAVKHREAGDIYADSERARLGREYLRRAQAGKNKEELRRSRQFQAASQRQVLETFSTPLLYAVCGSAARGDYDHDLGAFERASLVLYVLAIVLLCWMLRCSLGMSALLLVLCLAFFDPLESDVQVGNVNRLQLALLALFLMVQRAAPRRMAMVLAGAILGLAVCFKPNLAFVAVAWSLGWLLAGDLWRVLLHGAGLLAGAVLAIAGSSRFFGSVQPWRTWLLHLDELFGGFALPLSKGNFALAQVAAESAGVRLLPWLPLGLLVLCALCAWRGAGRAALSTVAGARRFDCLLVSAGAIASLLGARLAWVHYHVLVIPAVIVLLCHAASARPRTVVAALVAFAMVAGKPLAVITASDAAAAWVTSGGAAWLFALLLRELLLEAPRGA
ncbi:MAG: hypothetical protein U1E76_18975 [Planctomycetota bacterium]